MAREKKPRGNPTHIAKVKEIAASTRERMRSKLPDALKKEVELATMTEMMGQPIGDLRHHAMAAAMSETHLENSKRWREWRRELSERLNLSGADFSELLFLGLRFDHADMRDVSFTECSFWFCSFKDADLQGASFARAEMQVTSFRGARLERASFARAKMVGPDFEGARLAGADFAGAVLEAPSVDERTDFAGATFTGCSVKKFSDGSGGDLVKAFRSRLSDEQQKQVKSWIGCFVATAACGDPKAWCVVTLQQFRDRIVMRAAPGRRLVDTYYRNSPCLGSLIARSPLLCLLVKAVLVCPCAALAWLMMKAIPTSRQ